MNHIIFAGLPQHVQSLSVSRIPLKRSKNQNYDKLLSNACFITGAKKSDLLNDSRLRDVISAKRLYFHYLRQYTDISLKAAANTLGLDHTTVLYHVKTAKNYIDIKDPEYTSLFNSYKEINSGLLV